MIVGIMAMHSAISRVQAHTVELVSAVSAFTYAPLEAIPPDPIDAV